MTRRPVRINNKFTLVALDTYDDAMSDPESVDMAGYPLEGYLDVLLGDSDSTTGDIRLEESNGDNVWSPLAIIGFESAFIPVLRQKRYIRIAPIGLEAATTTILGINYYG